MNQEIINRLIAHNKIVQVGKSNTACHYHVLNKEILSDLLVSIPNTCHKGHFGHILIYEGHERYLGASRLAAYAALRAGAGLVTIATHRDDKPTAFDIPEIMRIKIAAITKDFLGKINAVVIGPGLSIDQTFQNQALAFLNGLQDFNPLIVIDADALKLLKHPDLNLEKKVIIATPHAKEAADLLEIASDRFDQHKVLEMLASLPCNKKNHIIWVLKEANTQIRHVDGTTFSFKGELPVLSAGGMGDVLSGTIAGLVKQIDCGLCASLLAVSLQIHSASVLSKSVFKGILAREIADMFPRLLIRS